MSDNPSELYCNNFACTGDVDVGKLKNLIVAPHSHISVSNCNIKDVADPRDGGIGFQDSATKRYVDTIFPSRFLTWLEEAEAAAEEEGVPANIGVNTSPEFVNIKLTLFITNCN